MGNSVTTTVNQPKNNLYQGSWWLTADYQHWDTNVESRHVITYHPERKGYRVKVLKYHDEEIRYAVYYLHCNAEGHITEMSMDSVRHPVRVRWTDGVNLLVLEGCLPCGKEFMSVFSRDQYPSAHCWTMLEKILGPCDSWRSMNKSPGSFIERTSFHAGMGCTFNGKLYSGQWWEGGRYPLHWEKSCVRSKADYTVNTDSGEIEVTNYCYNEFNDQIDARSGLATPVSEGHFSLSFTDGGPVSAIKSPYVVAWTDYQNYAIVGCMGRTDKGELVCHGAKWNKMDSSSDMQASSSNCELPPKQSKMVFGWLLTRKHHIPEIERDWLAAKLHECGYEASNMMWAPTLFI